MAECRSGYDDQIPSDKALTKESIREYYVAVDKTYGINSEEGIQRYIRDRLGNSI